MNKSIKSALLAMVVLSSCLVQTVYAQGQIDPEARIQQMISSLEVTSEQEPKFREIMNAYYASLRESMSGGGGDRAAIMASIQTLQAEQEKNLSGVLNEAQMGKYREQQAARRARMGQ